MTLQFVLVGIAVLAGMIQALQIGMIGDLTRRSGTFEAVWISMAASLAGLTLVLSAMLLGGRLLDIPPPFSMWWVFSLMSTLMTGALVASGRDLPSWLLLTGLTSIPYLLISSWVGTRIGLAALFASIVTGQLAGSVTLDHFGAFGAERQPIDVSRVLGVVALLFGVYLIRGRS